MSGDRYCGAHRIVCLQGARAWLCVPKSQMAINHVSRLGFFTPAIVTWLELNFITWMTVNSFSSGCMKIHEAEILGTVMRKVEFLPFKFSEAC